MVQTDQHQAAAVHDGHGNSVAAWTAVTMIMLGSLVMSVGVAIPRLWVGIAGGVLVVGGALAGKILSVAGFGVSGRPGG